VRLAPARRELLRRRAREREVDQRAGVGVGDLLEDLIVDRDRRREIAAAETRDVLTLTSCPW
jgi:hypothetical protein